MARISSSIIMLKPDNLKPFIILLLCLLTSPVQAVGDRIIEAIMRSDFIFDKNISNVPFFPLGYLQVKYNDDLSLDNECFLDQSCDFSFTSLSQGFGLPVWIGQKDMLILAETLESDRLQFDDQSLTINSAGVMAAWISQPSSQWQAGIFAYYYDGVDEDRRVKPFGGNIVGGGGRYRHESTFHSYWGLVRLDDRSSNALIYPYLGFDWFIGKDISVSGLIPWPSVSYSPDRDTIYKLGASVSGSDFFVDNNNDLVNSHLGIVDLGFYYEKRLSGMFWLEAGAGYSGFSRLSITSDNDFEFDSNLERSPFIRISFNLRPE